MVASSEQVVLGMGTLDSLYRRFLKPGEVCFLDVAPHPADLHLGVRLGVVDRRGTPPLRASGSLSVDGFGIERVFRPQYCP